jgi:hypothetical protein
MVIVKVYRPGPGCPQALRNIGVVAGLVGKDPRPEGGREDCRIEAEEPVIHIEAEFQFFGEEIRGGLGVVFYGDFKMGGLNRFLGVKGKGKDGKKKKKYGAFFHVLLL